MHKTTEYDQEVQKLHITDKTKVPSMFSLSLEFY